MCDTPDSFIIVVITIHQHGDYVYQGTATVLVINTHTLSTRTHCHREGFCDDNKWRQSAVILIK